MPVFHPPFLEVTDYLVQPARAQGSSRQAARDARLQQSAQSADPGSAARGMLGTQELGTAWPDKGTSWRK